MFSTITKQQINECTVPDVFNPQFDELHTLHNTLESRIIAAELENQVLARMHRASRRAKRLHTFSED